MPLALGGCISVSTSGCGSWSTIEGTRELSVAHQAASPLVVKTGNGSITLVQGGSTEVAISAQVRARTQERLDAVQIVAQRLTDGTLNLSAAWPGGKPLSNEGCAFTVTIPDVSRINAETSNGRIEVQGLAGSADLSTSNGKIQTTNFPGEVVARTSNGSIELTDVTKADADTSNGSISITLRADASGPVRADSSNGSITLRVGPGFNGDVIADTNNGGVSCDAPGATVVRKGRTSGQFNFGATGLTHTLDTSNGSILIQGR